MYPCIEELKRIRSSIIKGELGVVAMLDSAIEEVEKTLLAMDAETYPRNRAIVKALGELSEAVFGRDSLDGLNEKQSSILRRLIGESRELKNKEDEIMEKQRKQNEGN